jgi:hypothetical protein
MLALFLFTGAAQADREFGYSFTLNGKPFVPHVISLDADRDNPKAGDLIRIGHHMLTLGKQKKCDFIITKREDGRVFLKDGDKKRVVSVRVSWGYDGDTKVIYNPIAKLSAAEVKGLWGLVLDEWPAGIEKKLSEIDPARTCLTVTEYVAREKDKSFPKLPPKLRYLRVENTNGGIANHDSLGRFTELRVLIGRFGCSLDLRLVSKNKHLRYLDLSGSGTANEHALAALTELRGLDMSYCGDLKSVAFVRGMKHLRFLYFSRSGISDLSPLGGLKKLQRVKANSTPVIKLPKQRLPALRELHVMSAPIKPQAVRAFHKAHPKSIVTHGWTDAFRQVVKNVTCIHVRSGATYHGSCNREKTLFMVRDAKEIKAFVANVRVREPRQVVTHPCLGDPTIEFYEDKKTVARLVVIHGDVLRWPGGWPEDAPLVEASADYIAKWLSDHGVAKWLSDHGHGLAEWLSDHGVKGAKV